MIAHWSKLFIPTLREAPAGLATEGAKLLARAGYVRGETSLFLGQRARRRIAAVIRRELEPLGAQELHTSDAAAMFDLARELRSYKQLPQLWFRLDSDLDVVSLEAREAGFEVVSRAIRAVLEACKVECLTAKSVDGLRLVIPSESGKDVVARAGDHLAEFSSAVSLAVAPAALDPEGDLTPEPFHTPNRKTIAELAQFTGLPETSHIKSLVMSSGGVLVMALLRGDHQLSEAKLAHALGAAGLRPACANEILDRFGANPGSLGPVDIEGIRILADEALCGRRNMIAGANRDDYHLRHVTPGKAFACDFFDLRQACEGERSTANGEPLRVENAVILAALRKRPVGPDLHVTAEAGREVPLDCGSYSLSLDRVLWAIAEQHHDADGLALPAAIAPFDVIVTPLDPSTEPHRAAVAAICEAAQQAGLDVLIDDRDERPGVKFKDNDLTGIPWRIVIGKKLAQGQVEVFERKTKQKSEAALEAAVDLIRTRHQ